MSFDPPEKRANSEERRMLAIRESTHDTIRKYANEFDCSMTKMLDAIIKYHVSKHPLK